MNGQGLAMMGTGEADGMGRAREAAQRAISSPLLEDIDISGAMGVLLNITGNSSMTLHEVNDAAMMIQEAAHEDANIIFGAVIDEKMGSNIRITVIATGFEKQTELMMTPQEMKRETVQEKPRHIEVKLSEEEDTAPYMKTQNFDSMEFRKRIKELGLDSTEEDEYDIPTFLRKQVD